MCLLFAGYLETSVIMELFWRKCLGWYYELSSTTNVPYKPHVPLTAQSPAYSSLRTWAQTEAMPSNSPYARLLPHTPLELACCLCAEALVLLDEFYSPYFAAQGTLHSLHFFPWFLFCGHLCSHILREGDYFPLCRGQPEFSSVAGAWSLALSPVPSVCFSCFIWSTFSM